MIGSQITLGSSCATLHDGVQHLEKWEEEQQLLHELQDHKHTLLPVQKSFVIPWLAVRT